MKGPRRSSRRPVAAFAILALAAVLIVWGIAQGDALDTLRKAALICFECIGIG
ncbi:MAG: hypothetical protein LBO07_00925 [Coriobacteriales bacterium]|jgi:hypothetical protein|nr:hypothetical protein [Coriobacteriales bacterium]